MVMAIKSSSEIIGLHSIDPWLRISWWNNSCSGAVSGLTLSR